MVRRFAVLGSAPHRLGVIMGRGDAPAALGGRTVRRRQTQAGREDWWRRRRKEAAERASRAMVPWLRGASGAEMKGGARRTSAAMQGSTAAEETNTSAEAQMAPRERSSARGKPSAGTADGVVVSRSTGSAAILRCSRARATAVNTHSAAPAPRQRETIQTRSALMPSPSWMKKVCWRRVAGRSGQMVMEEVDRRRWLSSQAGRRPAARAKQACYAMSPAWASYH